MMLLDILSGEVVVLLLTVSVLLIELMAGFFFAYSISVVLALETLSASAYTNMIQEISEKVLDVAFGVVFFGAVAIPVGSAVIVLFRGDWAMQYGQLYLTGVVVYLIGTVAVTMRIHIPMNDAIGNGLLHRHLMSGTQFVPARNAGITCEQ